MTDTVRTISSDSRGFNWSPNHEGRMGAIVGDTFTLPAGSTPSCAGATVTDNVVEFTDPGAFVVVHNGKRYHVFVFAANALTWISQFGPGRSVLQNIARDSGAEAARIRASAVTNAANADGGMVGDFGFRSFGATS